MGAQIWAEGSDMLDLVHDSIIVRDMDGRIVQWNAAAETQYGWSRDEAIGRGLRTLLRCSYPEPLEAIEAELLEKGGWEGEFGRTARDGRDVWVDARWSLKRDAQGRPHIVETGRDVTARRQAEEAARLSDYRFRNLFQAMAVAFWEIDFTGVGALLIPLRDAGITDLRAHFGAHPELVREAMRAARVVDVNAKAVSLFGARAADELIGGNVERYWPDKSAMVFAEALVETFEKRPHLITETKLRDLAGRPLDVLFTVSWSPESRRQGILLIGIIDITERRQAERMLRQVQADFAHAARVTTLGELTASIAHEVNQPLAAIATNAEASLRWLARDVPDVEEVRTLAGRIAADARRAADIISQIRAMASRSTPEPALLSVNALVRDSLDFLRPEFRAHETTVDFIAGEDLPAVVGDRTQLQQVLVNLAVNALQALDASEGARQVVIRTSAGGERVRIEVEDNGPGVPPDQAGRLFDSFFTTKPSGLGIGLAICRSIVEAHGGEIGLENVGSGARFGVTLPAAVVEPAPVARVVAT